MRDVRRIIRDQALAAVGARAASGASRGSPPEGLFAPDAVARRVHGDLAAMMIGGVGSLLLQMLHPSALAGVWDHSDFRHDMAGRLRRTARFVSVTTYGARDDALDMIARVRAIHGRVRGERPDGAPYSASDPDLLAFVHVAEAHSFLRAHLRYRDGDLTVRDQNRYFAEMAVVARLLGAAEVPVSAVGAADYLDAMRPELRWDGRTRRVAGHLLSQPPAAPALAPFNGLILGAGVDILPDWAADMHGLRRRPREARAVRAGARGAAAVLRWAMRVDAAA